ncbi:MAG: DUF3300 domain-containing protein [Thermodesulfovibrionales bacterium]
MKIRVALWQVMALSLILLVAVPPDVFAQDAATQPTFKPEELEQMLAPVALYPDSLLTQILMASTYPLEVVQADRWAKKNKDLKGDAFAKALEAQPWDPSVKSLVNFPDVLTVMSEKLDLTQKVGDAFLAQQKDVMATIQKLRAKAEASGNLKTTKEQVVKVEKEVIIIESSSPEVVYVPSYNPTVVYGAWPYPAYPPAYYYPPVVTPYAFGAGIAIGAAWGYAWGHSDWHGGDVDIDVNRNSNVNRNIDRSKYSQQRGEGGRGGQGGQGKWQHDAGHRGGASYRDQGTAQKYNRGTGSQAAQSRDAYRGRAEQGRQDISKGGADQFKGGDRSGSRQGGGAFSGMDKGGSATRDFSSRGSSSRQGMSSGGAGGSRSGSGFSGGGGGGGSRSGGFSGGGGGGRGGGGGGGRGGGGGGRR